MKNLIQQFPDATIDARLKTKPSLQRLQAIPTKVLTCAEEQALQKFYDTEFTKWHIKLVVAIVSFFAIIFFAVAKVPVVVKWFTTA